MLLKPNQLEVYSVILLENAGYFLLLKRAASKSFAPGRWTGVGERVEAGEFNLPPVLLSYYNPFFFNCP
jgi:8-oxo-dGTP diphosphatase